MLLIWYKEDFIVNTRYIYELDLCYKAIIKMLNSCILENCLARYYSACLIWISGGLLSIWFLNTRSVCSVSTIFCKLPHILEQWLSNILDPCAFLKITENPSKLWFMCFGRGSTSGGEFGHASFRADCPPLISTWCSALTCSYKYL